MDTLRQKLNKHWLWIVVNLAALTPLALLIGTELAPIPLIFTALVTISIASFTAFLSRRVLFAANKGHRRAPARAPTRPRRDAGPVRAQEEEEGAPWRGQLCRMGGGRDGLDRP